MRWRFGAGIGVAVTDSATARWPLPSDLRELFNHHVRSTSPTKLSLRRVCSVPEAERLAGAQP